MKKYTFEFGSLTCKKHSKRNWYHRWWKIRCTHGCLRGYIPTPTSMSAQYLKVVELLGGEAPRCFYSDSANVSNLSEYKAGFLKHVGKGRMKLTQRGRWYLRTHKVSVDLKEWLTHHTQSRHISQTPEEVLITAGAIEHKTYDVLEIILRRGLARRQAMSYASRVKFGA